MSTLLIKNTHPLAKMERPKKAGDAGYDLTCVKSVEIKPHTVGKVDIGLEIALPEPLVCTFLTRSSAIARGLFVLPTLIDTGYRGPLYLFVMNVGDKPETVDAGSRIAQLFLLDNHSVGVELEHVNELPASARGTSGFGSTGA